MKFNYLAILFCILLSACGNDSREEELKAPQQEIVKDSVPTLQGEFIFLDSAAVLKGPDFIYGVHIDSISLNLAEKLEPLKNDDFDMLPVVVKAKIIQNPRRDGWDEIIEIREIISTPKATKDTLKTTSEKKE